MTQISKHYPVKFREDINGLRAWAVLAVLLFHFSLIGLPGGFAGVDVFFVISGYLMTSIIIGNYEKGNFSILKFYAARIRRILPALITVTSTLLILGWFLLPKPDYQSLSTESLYGISFLSNFYYWSTSGYFDSTSEEKWLLHTWSLAVEAQFYIFYPIFLSIIWRFWKSLKAITISLLSLFLISMTLNLIVSESNSTAAFYMLPTRGWELIAGGLVHLFTRQGITLNFLKAKGYWLGWILVLSSFIFLSENTLWPSFWAAIPVLGTSLIIFSQRKFCRLTHNPIAQWIGDRSYSLYLWHWPLIVTLFFLDLKNDYIWVISAFLFSILLAHLSYRYIEAPTRQYLSKTKFAREILIIGIVFIVIIIYSMSIQSLNIDDKNRLIYSPQKIKYLNGRIETLNYKTHWIGWSQCSYISNHEEKRGCKILKEKEDPNIAVIGDSHAGHLASGFKDVFLKRKENVAIFLSPGCFPTYPVRIKGSNFFSCENNHIEKSLNFAIDNKTIQTVILSGYPALHIQRNRYHEQTHKLTEAQIKLNLEALKQGLNQTFNLLTNANKKIIFIIDNPEQFEDPKKCLKFISKNGCDLKITKTEYLNRNNDFLNLVKEIKKDFPNILFINASDYFCDNLYCYGYKKGNLLYQSRDHLSPQGSINFVNSFKEVLINSIKNE